AFQKLPGVGRAAVVACCWLLRLGYFKDHREVIEWVRAQRSPKAIETKEQAQFVAGFHLWSLGGESRTAGLMYENEIQRRIDWSESNMAQAREQAAARNRSGHHHHQVLHAQQQQPQAPQLARERSHSSTSSILSTASVSSRQANPVSPSSLSGANLKPSMNGSTSDHSSR
ncbi:hypothetical protein EDD21DRAFT_157802, partial [Dissophora ornata]